MRIRLINILTLLTNIVLYFVTFFIGTRIVLRFLSANPSTPIVAWIYDISAALIYPFIGIFPDLGTQTGVLDMVAIIALLGYVIAGFLVTWLFRTLIISTEQTLPTATSHYHDIDEDSETEEVHTKHYSR